MRRPGRPATALLAVLTLTTALSGCTGVPASSVPEVVTAVNGGQSSEIQVSSPAPNTDPRTLVHDFLVASEVADTRAQVAQNFLTRDASQRWNGSTVTVLSQLTVGNFDKGSIQVSGYKVGTVDATGVFTPDLQGTGNGAGTPQFTTSIGVRDDPKDGWRIDNIPNGLLVDAADFDRVFQQRTLYFFDSAEQRLVADPRYTSYADSALLGKWLATQLAAGPQPDLNSATKVEMPTQAQTDPTQVGVTLGSPLQVTVPGAAQLPGGTKANLAAQIAYTMLPVTSGDVQIVDAGRPVPIPGAGDRFTASQFSAATAPANETTSLYYLVDGRVVDVDGKSFGAPTTYALTSVALARVHGSDLRLAGTSGTGANAQLVVGTIGTGMHETGLRGLLSRPSWAPRLDEVWVGNGSTLYRVGLRGKPTQVQLSATSGTVRGQLTAVRFSPEGARVALVLRNDEGSQIWIGSVSRNAQSDQVVVDSLQPISPQGITVTDVAWNDQLNLFAIGHDATTGVPSVYEVHVDGSLWTSRGISNLPQAPDSITVTQNEVAWVSADNTVWAQAAGAWVSPGAGETRGDNPVYLE